MLLDEDEEQEAEEQFELAAQRTAVFLTGMGLLGALARTPTFVAGRLTPLEKTYLAGKLAAVLGPDDVRNLSAQDAENLLNQAATRVTAQDRRTMDSLRKGTRTWLSTRGDAWKQRFRKAEERGEKDLLGRAEEIDPVVAQQQAIQNLLDQANNLYEEIATDVDTLTRTEMGTYFQQGMTANEPGDRLIYKIPRAEACEYCLWLHLNRDGSYKVYKLSEVRANSNIGLKADEWDFTIGPVHPHCYCIPYFLEPGEKLEANEDLAEIRENSAKEGKLEKSLRDHLRMLVKQRPTDLERHNYRQSLALMEKIEAGARQ